MKEVVLKALVPDFGVRQIHEINPLKGGVSGSVLARVVIDGHDLVAKVGPTGVGKKEREGARQISPFIPVPKEFGPKRDDHYLRRFVDGLTVDQIIRAGGGYDPPRVLDRFLEVHSRMWLATFQHIPATTGYPTKITSTTELLISCQIGGQPIREMMDLPVMINRKKIPSIAELIAKIEEILRAEDCSVLSHGDEGACNSIVTHNGQQFAIDHGTVGRRALCEPTAKMALWFPATLARPERFAIHLDGRIDIDYSVVLEPRIRSLVKRIQDRLFATLRDKLSIEAYYAGLTMYLLREMQWLRRRGRELMTVYILAMALEAGAKLFGARGDLAYM